MKLSDSGTRPRLGSKPASLLFAEAAAIASSVKVEQIDHICRRKSSLDGVAVFVLTHNLRDSTVLRERAAIGLPIIASPHLQSVSFCCTTEGRLRKRLCHFCVRKVTPFSWYRISIRTQQWLQ